MKRFLSRLFLFSLPFWGLLVWLLAADYPSQRGWTMVLKDCRTGEWIYQRLHENPKPVEVAFVGTSRTMCGVFDSLIQKNLVDSFALRMQVASFGVCRPGNNLHYLLAREIIDAKKPALMIVEVQNHFHPGSHSHFPALAQLRDLASAPLIVNTAWFSDWMQGIQARLLYRRDELLGVKRKYLNELTNPDHSFVVVPVDGIADSVSMEKTKARRSQNQLPPEPAASPSLTTRATRIYYERIAAMCKEQGIKLVFLYFPGYGTPEPEPVEAEWLRSQGELWLPPATVFGPREHYFDADHLNRKGATAFAAWLSQQITGWKQANP